MMGAESDAQAGEGDPIADMEAIKDALDALSEDRADADADALEGAIAVTDSLMETAEDEGEEDAEAYEKMDEANEALQRIADGEGSEEDVELAGGFLAVLGEQMQSAVMEMLLGGEV